MRGQTLDKLLNGLRAEARLSLDPAHNTNDRAAQVMHLQRVQEWLWDDHDWPFLRVERTIPVVAGQRFYDFPEDLSLDRVEKLEFFADGAWCLLAPGIDSGCYTIRNPELGETDWPPRRWRLYEDAAETDQANTRFEIWPVPDRDLDSSTLDGQLKFTGIRRLQPLVADTDRADLDDRMIVLFAAAERLASAGSKDAKLKQDLALKRYAKMRGETQIVRRFRMFGIGGCERSRFGIPIVAVVGAGGSGGGGGSVIVDGGLEGPGSVASLSVSIDPTVEGGNNTRQTTQSPTPAVLGYEITVDGGREG